MTKKLPTIDIKGKPYTLVKDRILAFHELHPKGQIKTEILKNDDLSVVIKATVEVDNRIFTGHSEAYRGNSQMGMVAVEVSETSAVGRALAMMGIGVIDSVASADEIKKSFGSHADTMTAGKITPKQKDFIMELCISKGVKISTEELNAMNSWQASQRINSLKKLPDKVKSNAEANAELDFVGDLPDDNIPVIEDVM